MGAANGSSRPSLKGDAGAFCPGGGSGVFCPSRGEAGGLLSLEGEAGVFCPSRGEVGVSPDQAAYRDGVQVGMGLAEARSRGDKVLNPTCDPCSPSEPVHSPSAPSLPDRTPSRCIRAVLEPRGLRHDSHGRSTLSTVEASAPGTSCQSSWFPSQGRASWYLYFKGGKPAQEFN